MSSFAPTIYITEEHGKVKPYKLLVYVGHKTLVALLFEVNYNFTYDFLTRLDAHLAKHAPVISQLIDGAVQKVLVPDDPCKFFYYNEANYAVKISNLITMEVFNYELKL
mmetsp:Transcript_39655/g.60736  ORF Transcript_39655/g.60736 Transcript_39655/m.60736 type:complete len:109 (+) Transcript_39655:1015-1341(+)